MSWGKYKKRHFFFISIEKEVTKIDKDGSEGVVTISYKIKFTNSVSNFIIKSYW